MDAPISRYGAMAAATALLTIAATAYLALAGRQCPIPLLVALYGAGAAEIIVLCRVEAPPWMQGVLILFLIASLTTLTARTDVLGVHGTDPTIAGETAVDPARKATPATTAAASRTGPGSGPSSSANGSGAEGGAKVVFSPAGSGDGGWAKMLNAAYDRRLGGAQASGLMISGDVDARQIGIDTSVVVRWGISADGVSLQCGSTSAYGSNGPALSEQFRQGFGSALSRSVELRRVSCP
jgi:hypothetical protein